MTESITMIQKTLENAYNFHLLCPFCATYSGQMLLYSLDEAVSTYDLKDLKERPLFLSFMPFLCNSQGSVEHLSICF